MRHKYYEDGDIKKQIDGDSDKENMRIFMITFEMNIPFSRNGRRRQRVEEGVENRHRARLHVGCSKLRYVVKQLITPL